MQTENENSRAKITESEKQIQIPAATLKNNAQQNFEAWQRIIF